jgi:hypothetical protein
VLKYIQTLKSLLNDLKVILKPVRILLKPKGPWSNVLNSIRFPPEEILGLRRIAGALGNLVIQERLIGYIPYMIKSSEPPPNGGILGMQK